MKMKMITLPVCVTGMKGNFPVEVEEDVFNTLATLIARKWSIAAVTIDDNDIIGMCKVGTDYTAIQPFHRKSVYDNEYAVTVLVKWAAGVEQELVK